VGQGKSEGCLYGVANLFKSAGLCGNITKDRRAGGRRVGGKRGGGAGVV
jgi:hypothetical protein